MAKNRHLLPIEEIRRAFAEGTGTPMPPIISIEQLSRLVGKSPKTLYQWIAQGRLDGAFRKRGKHLLFWRDRVIEILFNGREWKRTKKHESASGND